MSQAKLSKKVELAALELGYAARKLITRPAQFFTEILDTVISPLAEEREARLQQNQAVDAVPEWARNTYTRDWDFPVYESKEDRIKRIRREAGRKGGLVRKTKQS